MFSQRRRRRTTAHADIFTQTTGACRNNILLLLTADPRQKIQNAYLHFRAHAPPSLYRAGKSCSYSCKATAPNRPAIQGRDRHEARRRHCGNHEAGGNRNPLRLSGQSPDRICRQCRHPPRDGAQMDCHTRLDFRFPAKSIRNIVRPTSARRGGGDQDEQRKQLSHGDLGSCRGGRSHTKGASRHTASSSRPSMTGGCAARVAAMLLTAAGGGSARRCGGGD